MPTIADYLNNLKKDKNNLVTNLNTKGVAAENNETFTQLVPKVLDIDTSGLDTSDATATPEDMKQGVTAYANGEKITGTAYTRGAVTAVIDGQQHWLQEGFYSGITIPGDEDLIPENIKKDVEIYGVTGTLETSSTSALDTSDATATAGDILEGKTAYIDGEKVTGTILSQEEQIIVPSTIDKIISPGVYIAGTQTIQGDINLLAGNIKKGVTIFGVTGTYVGSGGGSEVVEGTLIDTSTFTSGQQTLDTYGQSIYVSESTEDTGMTILTLSEIVEKYGGITAQNSYIGDANNQYGVAIANWSGNGEKTGILFMNPIALTAERLLLTFNCNLSTWMTANLNIHLIQATGETEAEIIADITNKISTGDYALSHTFSYPGAQAKQDILVEVDNVPTGTYYVYIDGTKKGDSTALTYITINYVNF